MKPLTTNENNYFDKKNIFQYELNKIFINFDVEI